MKLVDHKNKEIKIGEKVKIIEDIPSVDGMLHKDRIVRIDEVKDGKIRVTDRLGKIWWVESHQINKSFL